MNDKNYLVTGNVIKLTGKLNFQSVPDIQRNFSKLLPTQSAWDIDLSGVQFSDSSGLALLAECLRLAKWHQFTVRFMHMPQQMLSMARVTGLEKLLPVAS